MVRPSDEDRKVRPSDEDRKVRPSDEDRKVLFSRPLAQGVYEVGGVAIKIFPRSELLSALTEIELTVSLSHPHIIRGRGWVSGDVVGVATPLALGDLEGLTLTPSDRQSAVRQIVSAVDYLHLRGVLHLDIKPANVLVYPGARGLVAKLADFGSAVYLSLGPSTPSGRVTYSFPVVTPGWRPPELDEAVVGVTTLGFEVDVWSLGRLLAWGRGAPTKLLGLMLDSRPEVRPSVREVARELGLPPPPDQPDPFAELYARATSKLPRVPPRVLSEAVVSTVCLVRGWGGDDLPTEVADFVEAVYLS